MVKFDMANAYWNVAIHPGDRPLLGMQWCGQYFVDLVLPFGLCSAPFIFTAIADLVEWILVHNYDVTFLRHYLDDFLTWGCHLRLSATITFKPVFVCVNNLAYPFILISWRVLRVVLPSLGLNLTLTLQARLLAD